MNLPHSTSTTVDTKPTSCPSSTSSSSSARATPSPSPSPSSASSSSSSSTSSFSSCISAVAALHSPTVTPPTPTPSPTPTPTSSPSPTAAPTPTPTPTPVPPAVSKSAIRKRMAARGSHWSFLEKARFEAALQKHGLFAWRAIIDAVGTRSEKQVKAYAARYRRRKKLAAKAAYEAYRDSLHLTQPTSDLAPAPMLLVQNMSTPVIIPPLSDPHPGTTPACINTHSTTCSSSTTATTSTSTRAIMDMEAEEGRHGTPVHYRTRPDGASCKRRRNSSCNGNENGNGNINNILPKTEGRLLPYPQPQVQLPQQQHPVGQQHEEIADHRVCPQLLTLLQSKHSLLSVPCQRAEQQPPRKKEEPLVRQGPVQTTKAPFSPNNTATNTTAHAPSRRSIDECSTGSGWTSSHMDVTSLPSSTPHLHSQHPLPAQAQTQHCYVSEGVLGEDAVVDQFDFHMPVPEVMDLHMHHGDDDDDDDDELHHPQLNLNPLSSSAAAHPHQHHHDGCNQLLFGL